MQQSTQEPAQNTLRARPVFLSVDTIMGMPHSHATLAEGESVADEDFLAAVSCALYAHAMSMVEALDLGTLRSIECHLSSGVIVMHQDEGGGDLLIHNQSPQPAA